MKCSYLFRKPFAKTAILGIVFFAMTACHKDKQNQDTTCNQTLPAVVSFGNDMQPIFKNNCALSGCHSGTSPKGNLCLDSAVAYSQLMQPGKGYVDTLHPSYSILYLQMTSSSKPMPPAGKLDVCTTDLVLKWIEQKAKNN